MAVDLPRYRFCRTHGPSIGDCPRCEAEKPQTVFQYFWRCAHHPSCIENFFAKRVACEFDCHTTNLEWHHNGTHPMPKSWSRTPRGSREWSELQRTGL